MAATSYAKAAKATGATRDLGPAPAPAEVPGAEATTTRSYYSRLFGGGGTTKADAAKDETAKAAEATLAEPAEPASEPAPESAAAEASAPGEAAAASVAEDGSRRGSYF